MSRRAADCILLIAIYSAIAAYAWRSRIPWVVSNFLLFGVPLAYLLLRSKAVRSNVHAKFTAKFILFAVGVFDFMCERYGGWSGPTVFPFRLPGGITVEEVQWIVFYFPLVLAINEHFFATERMAPRRAIARPLLSFFFFACIIFACIPQLHRPLISYVYLKIGLLLELPIILFALWVNRWALRELILTGVVTGGLNLIFELIALRNGYWTFPGSYVGKVRLFRYEFPLEEMLFLIVLSGPSIVATYVVYKNWKFPVVRSGMAVSIREKP